MNTYKTVSEEIRDLKARQVRQFRLANTILALILVFAILAAVISPHLANVSYDHAFTADGSTHFLIPFVTLSLIWFALAVYWHVPGQFASLPAITLLCIGYTVTTLALR